ncbi:MULTISPECIES: serine/threonine-protein kinase [unclassified Actinoplanes]|uniref:serine/threonine-protein kinase n=1 Tax=unclassified Actinoplanes TaxID=2626549 RepID=UPI001E61F842|nr:MULTISPECIES: serine/threonine-protein kinase [unclassified Actinoplanes]
MGRVWLARDQMLDRDVAIKEIVPPDWMSEAEKDRLHSRTLREARSAARLTHPHVVRVYDVLHDDGVSWIVMEYVASRSLYQVLITQGPYSPVEAARIGLAVLDALNAAHRAGVLHRDVKPHNVLIGLDGRVLLTDFGLATFVDDGMVTTPGLIVGSPQYVSPERARDGASTVAADMWSFGATLYATVEGQSPYARDSAMATLAALATEPPNPPLRAGPIGPILEGLLRYAPEDRLSADETERRLRAVLGETGPAAAARPATVVAPVTRMVAEDSPTVAAVAPPSEAKTDSDRTEVVPVATGELVRTADLAGTGLVLEGESGPAEFPEEDEADHDDDAEDSDGWWQSGRGYIDGTFTVTDDLDAGSVPAAAGHSHYGAGRWTDGGNRAPSSSGVPRAHHNRQPSAAGRPAATRLLRRGNQATVRGIPSPRSPVSGPLPDTGVPPGRWALHPLPAKRISTRAVLAGLLAVALISGSLLSVHLMQRDDSAPQMVHSPMPAPSGMSSSGMSPSDMSPSDMSPSGMSSSGMPASGMSPSSRASAPEAGASQPRASPTGSVSPVTAGFSPIVCDAPAPHHAPVAPQAGAGRGVDGWRLQAGWSYFTDGTGFHLPVPDGWTYQRIGSTYCFREPRGGRVLSLDVGRPAATAPLQGCRAEDRRLRASRQVRDYRAMSLAPVVLLHAAVDWEFRYRTSGGVLRRARTRWLSMGGRAYALGWATPEAAWAAELGKLEMVWSTFYTDGGTPASASRG